MTALRSLLAFATLTMLTGVAPFVAATGLLDPTAWGTLGAPLGNAHHPVDDDAAPPIYPVDFQPAEPRWEGAAGAGGYIVNFRCPKPTENSDAAKGCPLYLLDLHDVMGQPQLVIDPHVKDYMGFNALHGRSLPTTPTYQPPSDQSRDNNLHQPHTTFQTRDGFASTPLDNFYYVHDSMIRPGRVIFGEDNAIVLDAAGRVYIASLYAYRDSAAEPDNYALWTFKANRISDAVDYYSNPIKVPIEKSHKVDSIHLVYVKETDRVAVLWRESANDTKSGPKSWIDLAWTVPGEGGRWKALDKTQRIGPCSGISNPTVLGRELFVGCFSEAGYQYHANQTMGNLQIHSIDTATWTQRYVAPTPIPRTGNAVLGDWRYGRMFIASAGVRGDGKPYVELSYGERGMGWSEPHEITSNLEHSDLAARDKVREARVTAAAYVHRSGSLHLIYMERYFRSPQEAMSFGALEYSKTLASVRADGDYQGGMDLQIGINATRVDYGASFTGLGQGVFNDLHDDIEVWTDQFGNDHEFIAFGDYGYVRFARVEEDNFLPPIVPFAQPPPPIPAPTPGLNPAQVAAVAGALSAAILARLLAAKKKRTVEAPHL